MGGRARRGRPRISTVDALRQAARQFSPPYEVEKEAERALRISLRDPAGRLPSLVVRHQHERRLFLKANYLVAEAKVPGRGPPEDGELAFRFRGPLRRQRSSVEWRSPVAGGEEWTRLLETPLLDGVRRIQAIESLRIRWSAKTQTWHLRLETMSGSMVGGFMSPLPIAVPMEREEAEGVIALIEALLRTGG